MAATVANYSRKTGGLEVVKFDTSSVQIMEDVRDWVISNLSVDFTVNMQTSMGGLLYWDSVTSEVVTVRPNEYIVKDSNGKLLKMTKETLDLFFDEV